MGAHDVDPERHVFAPDGAIPNSSLPLLVWRGVLAMGEADPASTFEALFARNGWGQSWRWGIHGFHHFHSTAHEVLGVARGTARVRFGGPDGRLLALAPGDAVLIPAGVGHKDEGSDADLLVVGAYPAGQMPDLRRGVPAEQSEVEASLARVEPWKRLPV